MPEVFKLLSANGQFFVDVQVTVSLLFNSQLRLYKYGVFFYNSPFCFRQNQKLLNQYGTVSLFPGADAPHGYVRAWTLCCFHSRINSQTFRRALTESADSCAEIKGGVTCSSRVWRMVLDSDARRVHTIPWGCRTESTLHYAQLRGVPDKDRAPLHTIMWGCRTESTLLTHNHVG